MRITLSVGLAFALLIAGCSNKPASQNSQAPASSVTPAPPGDTSSGPAVQPASTPNTAASAATPSPTSTPAKPTASAALAAPSAAGQSTTSPSTKSPVGTSAKAPAASPTKEANAPAVATKPAPILDIASLTERLKDTKAIGVLSKLALKNQVDDLLDQFRAFYQGKLKTTLAELRRPYDLLVLKVLALLQDDDPSLASAIVASREAIWGILSDRKKFAAVA
jgi:hypothetical protein